jgi:outer membrane protein TolC
MQSQSWQDSAAVPAVLLGPVESAPGAETLNAPKILRELSLEALVADVLARNPSLAQMIAAWQAASARYPQVTSLQDPMLGTKLGPGSFGSNKVDFAYMAEVSQNIPFPGKLALRGDNALAEAMAAGHDVEDVRLQLIESIEKAFYEYYLIERSLEVNTESLKLWQQAKKDADNRYKTGKVDQQDVLQAEVEIGRERERRLTLEELRQIAIARINTLRNLPPDLSLPPSPKEIRLGEGLADVQDSPPSKTRAMLGWSMRARACRSASKRAITCRVSMPGLRTLRATFRRTGCCCSAMKTTPKPPSPICSSSLYGPMMEPGRSLTGSSRVAARPGTGASKKAPTWS